MMQDRTGLVLQFSTFPMETLTNLSLLSKMVAMGVHGAL